MERLKVLDLFSGIGGFSLGLERTGGFETVAFCEIEKFPQKVLKKHWPNVPIYEDVRELTGEQIRQEVGTIDVITGGFPCQDLSSAGLKAGLSEGTRSGLFYEIMRLARELGPKFIVMENVPNLLIGDRGKWFSEVLSSLAQCGYDAEWQNIPAAALGAIHLRERVWIVAYPNGVRFPGCGVFDYFYREADERFFEQRLQVGKKDYNGILGDLWTSDAAGVFGMGDGFSDRMGRIKGCGNAVVPQIPELIGKSILDVWGR